MTNIEFYFNRKTTKPPPTIKKWQENLSRERLGKKTRNTKLQKSQTNTHKKDLYMPPYTHNHSCNAWETSPQWRRQRWSEMAMTVNAARFDRGRTRERESGAETTFYAKLFQLCRCLFLGRNIDGFLLTHREPHTQPLRLSHLGWKNGC